MQAGKAVASPSVKSKPAWGVREPFAERMEAARERALMHASCNGKETCNAPHHYSFCYSTRKKK